MAAKAVGHHGHSEKCGWFIHLPSWSVGLLVLLLKNTGDLDNINNSVCKYRISGSASMKIAKYAFNLSLIRQLILF